MSIISDVEADIAKLEAGFQKTEQWVVAEIAKGRQLLQHEVQTAAVDISGILKWLQARQSTIISLLETALTAAEALIPGSAPVVAAAQTAIDAATAAVDVLAKEVIVGKTALSTASNTYHAVTDAGVAVAAVLKKATALPSAPAAAPAAGTAA